MYMLYKMYVLYKTLQIVQNVQFVQIRNFVQIQIFSRKFRLCLSSSTKNVKDKPRSGIQPSVMPGLIGHPGLWVFCLSSPTLIGHPAFCHARLDRASRVVALSFPCVLFVEAKDTGSSINNSLSLTFFIEDRG